jgi:Calx-beta domain
VTKKPPMKTNILLLLATFALMASQAATAAPVNDAFEKALPLIRDAPLLPNQTGVGSTPHALDPFIGGVKLTRSVWYRFDAVFNTNFNRFLINDLVGVRAAVFELTDPDGNAGTLKFLTQTNNILPNDTETLVFPTYAGKRYYLCVEGNGLFGITLQTTPRPNDYFGDAIILVGNEGTVTGSNVGASNANDRPTTPADHTPNAGVWYHWTPNFNGTAVVDTNFSEKLPNVVFDTIVAVFTGTTLNNLLPVASDDDSGFDYNSRVTFAAAAGTEYYIWVGGAGANVGTFYLSYFAEGNPGKFEIVHAPDDVTETQGSSVLHVCRFRAGNVAANVTAGTANGTAIGGIDFTAINSVLNFPNPLSDVTGWRQEVTLTILQDLALAESTETFNLTLSAPSPGASIGSSAPAGVTITPASETSVAGFLDSQIRVKEGGGGISIPLVRAASGGSVVMHVSSDASNPAKVQAGQDFFAVNEPIFFAAGQTQGIVYLYIQDDGLYEGDETITLQVSPQTPGLSQVGYDTIYITIEDDDLPVTVPGRVSAVLDSGDIAASVDLKITTTGAVSGKVIMAKASLPFAGKLVNGRLTLRLGSATAPRRTLTLELVNAATKTYRLILNDGDLGNTYTTTVIATNHSALTPCPVAGYHTFSDLNGGGGIPQLFAASIKVTSGGDATLTGKLFDGTSVTASGGVDVYNDAYLGASLYAGKGRIFARADLKATVETLSGGSFSLLRPGRANQAAELPALDIRGTSARTTRYKSPTPGQRALMVWNPLGDGHAELTGGGFAMLTVKALKISTANKVAVTVPLPESLKLNLAASTGFYTGTVIPTGSPTAKPIFGVLHQGGSFNGYGAGFFLNGILPGKIKLRGF